MSNREWAQKRRESARGIGEYFRASRVRHNWTLRQAEAWVGLSNPAISMIETERIRPSVEAIIRLCYAYKLPLEETLSLAGYGELVPMLQARETRTPVPSDNPGIVLSEPEATDPTTRVLLDRAQAEVKR